MAQSTTLAVGRGRSAGGAVLAASFGALVAQMCLTVLAPLVALFQTNLGASSTQLTWLNAAVFAPTAVLELNFGVLGDMFGRRRLIIGGQIFCAIGLLIAMFANSVTVMAIALVIIGFGAAALLPSTLATIAAVSPTPEARSKAIARWSLAVAVASAIGPFCAGVMAEKFNLHAAYSIQFALALIGAILSFVALPDTSAPEGRTLDWRGQVLVGIGLIAFIYAIIQGSANGWGSTSVVIGYIVAAVALAAFVLVELRHRAPMFQVRLLKIPAFRAAALTGLFGMLSFLGVVYAMDIKLGPINHKGPIMLAMPFVILQIIPLLLGPWLGRVLHHVSPRTLLIVGLVAMAAGEFWYVALGVNTYGLGALTGPILLVGVGFIFMFSSLTSAAVNSVPHEQLGMASGATSLVRETGQSLGAAVVGAIALTHAASLINKNVDGLGLPAAATAQIHGIVKEGGPLAIVNIPQLPAQVVQIGRSALESGFDLGVIVMACLSLVAAAVVAVTMRGPAARPLAGLDDEDEPEAAAFAGV